MTEKQFNDAMFNLGITTTRFEWIPNCTIVSPLGPHWLFEGIASEPIVGDHYGIGCTARIEAESDAREKILENVTVFVKTKRKTV